MFSMASGADTTAGGSGNDTFVFHIGKANGNTVIDLAGNGEARRSIRFVGYGMLAR